MARTGKQEVHTEFWWEYRLGNVLLEELCDFRETGCVDRRCTELAQDHV
jgi:hypothetical protein